MRLLVLFCALSLSSFSHAAAQSSPLSDSASVILAGPRAAALDSVLRGEVAKGFSGVVLIASRGEIILRQGYGLAVRQPKRPFVPSTVVQIGSNTKDFTAVDILRLQEAGKLSTKDSLGKYFKDVPADKRGITIWDLVTHKSGLPLYSGLDFEPVTRDSFIVRVMKMPLLFPPGTQQKYSNVGYSVLAAIIEQIVGDSYGGYTNKTLWQPLGMHDTGLLLANFDTLRLARGYQGGEDNGTMLDKPHAPDGPYWNIRGNGGFLSTVTDMYHFYDVLFNTAQLLTPATRDLKFPADVPVALAGSDMISFFLYERDPMAGLVMIIATNSSDYMAPKARAAIAPLLGLPQLGGGRQRVGGPKPKAAGAGAAVVAVALPSTPAGRMAAAYLRVFNANDTAQARHFMLDSMVKNENDGRTIEQRLSGYRGMRAQTGGITAVSVVSSKETEIVLKAVAGNGDDVTLTVTVEPKAPNRIVSIRIEAE